jgi:hypothetical protein
VANGFVAMAIATVLAIALISVRWYLWHRHQPGRGDASWPPLAPGGAVRRPPAARDSYADPRYPASGPGRPGPGPERRLSGPYSGSAGLGDSGGLGGSGPYNFSSGA